MKDFFKFTLATIVGILVTGAVIVGFGIISLIGIWATSETETVVKNNSTPSRYMTLICANGFRAIRRMNRCLSMQTETDTWTAKTETGAWTRTHIPKEQYHSPEEQYLETAFGFLLP